jgi:hypothetical protein
MSAHSARPQRAAALALTCAFVPAPANAARAGFEATDLRDKGQAIPSLPGPPLSYEDSGCLFGVRSRF